MSELTKKGVLTPQNATVGDVTIYTRNGKTIMRVAKNEKSHKKATLPKLRRQIAFANVIRLWRSMPDELRVILPLNPQPGQNRYNAFFHHNLLANTAWLPRELTKMSNCSMPFAGMRFSDGILDEVPLSLDGTRAMLGLSLSHADGQGNSVPQDRGGLTGALIRCNRGYYVGDRLRLLYIQVPDVQRPQPRYALYTLVLDPGSRLPLTGLHPDGVAPVFVQDAAGHCTAWGLELGTKWSLAVWHERVSNDTVQASPSHLLLQPALGTQWTTREDFNRAVESYGGYAKPDTMTPDDTEQHLLGEF